MDFLWDSRNGRLIQVLDHFGDNLTVKRGFLVGALAKESRKI